ncbi:hypothetical protein A4A49_26272 [Nicotiana attenuata]|uniref:Uncharacterized protein n=1 Tax=Nicotiana attenuata TaxID=49451 RepID=A0A1J6K6U1_NICAT|nr:hypothetical protein A4A49_26272 [Nicotiana attenuata]
MQMVDLNATNEGQGIPAVSRMSVATGCALKPTSDFSNKLGQPRHGSGILQAINSSLNATTTGLETAAAKEMTTDIMQPQHKFSKSGGADVQVAAAPARVAQHLEGQKDRRTALQANSPSSNGEYATQVTGSVAGIERRVVPSKKQTPKKNKMQQAEQNHFDALYNANVVDGMNTEENLQLVESNAADQNSSLTPVAVNLIALGSQILKNMNPMQAFTRNRSPIPIMQLDKAEFDNNTIYKLGLNTSNKHIPSNDTVNCSEDSVHPAHNLQDHAMMISVVPISWADQAEMEKDNNVDSADSYRATVKKNTSPTSTYIVSNAKSNASTGIKQKVQQLQYVETVKEDNMQEKELSPKAPGFVPTGPNGASGEISNNALISDHDRALLNALDSPKPHNCALSNG